MWLRFRATEPRPGHVSLRLSVRTSHRVRKSEYVTGGHGHDRPCVALHRGEVVSTPRPGRRCGAPTRSRTARGAVALVALGLLALLLAAPQFVHAQQQDVPKANTPTLTGGNQQISLSWTHATGSPDLHSYRIRYREKGTSSWNFADASSQSGNQNYGGHVTSATIPDHETFTMKDSTTYEVGLRAGRWDSNWNGWGRLVRHRGDEHGAVRDADGQRRRNDHRDADHREPQRQLVPQAHHAVERNLLLGGSPPRPRPPACRACPRTRTTPGRRTATAAARPSWPARTSSPSPASPASRPSPRARAAAG